MGRHRRCPQGRGRRVAHRGVGRKDHPCHARRHRSRAARRPRPRPPTPTRRCRQQRRHRGRWTGRGGTDRRAPPPARGQSGRTGGGHPGRPATDPRPAGSDRLRLVPRWLDLVTDGRCVLGLEVRAGGNRRRAADRVAAVAHPGGAGGACPDRHGHVARRPGPARRHGRHDDARTPAALRQAHRGPAEGNPEEPEDGHAGRGCGRGHRADADGQAAPGPLCGGDRPEGHGFGGPGGADPGHGPGVGTMGGVPRRP